MGYSRWDSDNWKDYSSSVSSAPAAAIFRSKDLHEDLNPKNIKFRESSDSDKNPKSTPIIIGVDETGSMGVLAEQIIKHGLGVVMKEIYDRKPVTDPHVLLAGLGDSTCDSGPCQVTQFESAVGPLTSQIEKIWIEHGGGGNSGESYPLLWYFAVNKTKCDAITKRKRKGYLFTIGDERFLPTISKEEIKAVFGDDIEESTIKVEDLYKQVCKHWEVFHIIVETGSTEAQNAKKHWRDLLGQRVIVIPNKDALAEVIVSTIQIIEGEDKETVADSWDGSTAVVVRDAIKNLDKAKTASDDALVRL